MADTTTGLHVKSLSTESVRAKLVDTGGTNEAAISAAGRISVDGSGVTQPVSGTVAVSSITTSVTPGTAATNLGKAQGAAYAANDVGVMSLGVRNDAGTILTGSADQDYVPLTTDATGALRVTGGSTITQYVGDAAATATPTGTMSIGLANAAAPTNVSADNDAVAMWMLRNGSPVVNLASGGTLVTLGQKVMASSLPVTIASDQSAVAVSGTVSVTGVATAANQTNVQIVDNAAFTDGTTTVMMGGYIFDDVAGTALTENDAAAARIDSKRAVVFVGEDATTRAQKWAISAAGALSSNITQVGGATHSATVPLFARMTDGTAVYSKTGQTAGTAAFAQLSDQTTAVAVIAGTAALKTDMSSVAGTATVTAGTAGVQAIGGPTAADAAIAIQPVTVGARASTATPTAMSADGDVVNLWASLNGSLNVILRDTTGTYVAPSATQYVGDAAATATPTTTMASALANAAAPSDVSANNDAVALWALRNGSLVVNVASAGTLWTNMGQTAGTGQFVRINDGTTTAGVIVGTTALKTDLSSIAGTAPGATAFVPARLTDGSAYYSNTGQTAGTSVFSRINDGTTTAGVIAGTTALKTDASSIAGAVPSATNPLPVRLTDGAAFYSGASGVPTDPKFSTQTSSALGAGANVTLTHYVTSGKTGQLVGADVSAAVPLKVEIGTIVTGSFTARVVLFTTAGDAIIWRAPFKTYITRASSDSTTGFGVKVTNRDNAQASDVYSTGFWDEI